mmetsp:Transcript_9599/g.11823  ORF Transcript_9599/g.11823 Transcript_9599/m.11823 type:complete len:147 (+) Transcript_9599:28-468(+)
MKLNLYVIAVIAAAMSGSVEAIRLGDDPAAAAPAAPAAPATPAAPAAPAEKKEQTIEIAPGSNHCVKLAQGDSDSDSDSEDCWGGIRLPVVVNNPHGKCGKDERPLQTQVQESIEKQDKQCEACKPPGSTPAAPAAPATPAAPAAP